LNSDKVVKKRDKVKRQERFKVIFAALCKTAKLHSAALAVVESHAVEEYLAGWLSRSCTVPKRLKIWPSNANRKPWKFEWYYFK